MAQHAPALSTNTRMRTGQIQGQVFIYILTIIVVGLLLLFGYRFFQGLLSQGCDVQEIQFKTDIENQLRQNIGYQSVTPIALDAPCGFSTVCFADSNSILTLAGSKIPSAFDFTNSPTQLAFVQDSLQSNVKRNVFLLKPDGSLNTRSIFSENVIANDSVRNYTCMDAKNNKFNILLTGTGRAVNVSEFQP